VDFSDPVFAIQVDGQARGGIGARRLVGERAIGAELGYWLGRDCWGRGLMTRVVAAYAPWVMDVLEILRLQAVVLDFNQASARVRERSGWVEEGGLRRAVRSRGGVRGLRLCGRIREGCVAGCPSGVARAGLMPFSCRLRRPAP